jgi:hypothetical protein
MALIVLATTIYLFYTGYSYYNTPLEERFYHPHYNWFKSSGIYGQGLGVLGTFLIFFGVTIYIARKRYNFMVKYLRLKYLLEFHIFLCVLGPILILFHTAFKFGGIVSVAFWSMVIVVLSGVIGRYIYIQIPRTIEGRELSLNEVKDLKTDLNTILNEKFNLQQATISMILSLANEDTSKTSKLTIGDLRSLLKKNNIPKSERKIILKMVKKEKSLSGKIERLQTMQKMLKYWHVLHMPFALIMLVIVIIHIIVTVSLGYKWIF